MASISEVENRFKTLKKYYDTNITGHVATTYDVSKIHSQDSGFISYLDKVKGEIDSFKAGVSGITPPNNYDKTWGYMDEINSKSQYGYTQIAAYRNSVENKSKEVFQEYVEKYKGLDGKYKGLVQTISNTLVQAKAAEKEANDYSAAASSALSQNAGGAQQASSYRSAAEAARQKRDKLVSRISTIHLPSMSETIEQIEELLNRGLGIG